MPVPASVAGDSSGRGPRGAGRDVERYDAVEVVEASVQGPRRARPGPAGATARGSSWPPTLAALRSGPRGQPDGWRSSWPTTSDPSVRALGWGGAFLFGGGAGPDGGRVAAPGRAPAGRGRAGRPPSRYDPATAWTLVAGGDILLDRGVALAISESARASTSRSTAGR